MDYVISSPVPAQQASTFTVTPSGCTLTYSYKFGNGTVLAAGNPLFSFPSPGLVQVGVSSDLTFLTTFTLEVTAAITLAPSVE